jgi:hypothetical protein
MYIPFEALPGSARIWIYQADRKFTEEEISKISERGKVFVEQWIAHQQTLKASFKVFHNLFLIIGVDESYNDASGCSIDKSIHFIREVEKTFNVNLFNRLNVVYNQNNENQILHFTKLKNLLKENSISLDTKIYNNLIATKQELENNWLVNIKESWVADRLV